MMPKVYISPERRTAPHGKYWGMEVYEHDVCCDIAHRLKNMLEANGFSVVIAEPTQDIRQRSDWANKNDVSYYLPLHSNASTNGTKAGIATGAQMLAHPSTLSRRACQCIYDELTALYPSGRGVTDGSAYVENNSTNMVSAYCELAFHDNPCDAEFIVGHKQELAEALAKGICSYFGKAYKATVTQPTNTVSWSEAGAILRAAGVTAVEI